MQSKNSSQRRFKPFRMALVVIIFSLAIWELVKLCLGVPLIARLPDVYEVGKGVAIYDRSDKHMCTVYADRDSMPVPLSKISGNMRMALLAAEDHHFYEHHGVDFFGVGRAIFSNARAGKLIEGGSTITQQLARNLYLDPQDRSVKRKFLEALLSLDIELNNSKDKILETYLNDIYFGRGVYGIERAAGAYFNKTAKTLSIPEAAFIAGIIRAPSELSSTKHLPEALERQHQVIDAMVDAGDLSGSDAEKVKQTRLKFRKGDAPSEPHPYYINYVVQQLKGHFSDQQLWQTGLRVYTNLDSEAQDAAEKYLNSGIRTAPAGISQGALVSISVNDGSVLALVGGVGDYRAHQWNRAVHAHTAGSAFKPFVYLTGLLKGALKPDTMLEDKALTVNTGFGQTYTPRNFDGRYLGLITVRQALSLSRNICAIRVAQAVGVDKIIETARAAGITSALDNNLTLALGSCAISPLELANAYATLARDGLFVPTQFIRQVRGVDEKILFTAQTKNVQVFGQEPVRQLNDILQDVVQHGTGAQAKLKDIAVAGKTGTADKARDIWFVGFTPEIVTAVWGGNDSYTAVHGNVTGGTVMAKIWHDYMTDYFEHHKPTAIAFTKPAVPLASKVARAINPSILSDIEQYEDGVKPAPEQMENSNLPDPAPPQVPVEDQGDKAASNTPVQESREEDALTSKLPRAAPSQPSGGEDSHKDSGTTIRPTAPEPAPMSARSSQLDLRVPAGQSALSSFQSEDSSKRDDNLRTESSQRAPRSSTEYQNQQFSNGENEIKKSAPTPGQPQTE